MLGSRAAITLIFIAIMAAQSKFKMRDFSNNFVGKTLIKKDHLQSNSIYEFQEK